MSKKLARSAVVYLVSNVANAGLPFFMLPILTRVLTPADYGSIAMFAAILGIFSAFSGLSVHGAIGVRFFQLERDEMKGFVTTCLIIIMVGTFTVLLFVLGNSAWLIEATNLPIEWLIFGVIFSGLHVVSQVRLSLWQVLDKPLIYGAFRIFQTILNLGISLYLILVLELAWQGRLTGQSIAILVFGLLAFTSLYHAGFIAWPRNFRAHATDALRFGIPVIPHVIGGFLIVSVDRFIIAQKLDLASAGIYMIAVQIGQALSLLTDAFNKAYAPWLMRQLSLGKFAPRNMIVLGTYGYFILVITIAIILGLTAPLFLNILVGEEFQDAKTVVVFILLASSFNGCYLMVTNYIFFESKTINLTYITFATGVVNVALTSYLVSQNGIVGAGQSQMICQFVAFIGTWFIAQKVHPMPWISAINRSK